MQKSLLLRGEPLLLLAVEALTGTWLNFAGLGQLGLHHIHSQYRS